MSGETPVTEELAFRVSPRTMQMLGRDIISSPIVAVLELVKNAYDADATSVTIRINTGPTNEGEIFIEDDGDGMAKSDLQEKWMVISTNDKLVNFRTAKGRFKVGEKGIGRLAMNRLAKRAIIQTQTSNDSNAWKLEIDWTKYERNDGELDKITHPLTEIRRLTTKKSGTTLKLQYLRDKWDTKDYTKLYNDLALLIPPFGDVTNEFVINFDCDEAQNLSGTVKSPLAEAAEYRLDSELTEDGAMHHTLTHRSGETFQQVRSWASLFRAAPEGPMPACGPLHCIIHFYLPDAKSLPDTQIRANEFRTFAPL